MSVYFLNEDEFDEKSIERLIGGTYGPFFLCISILKKNTIILSNYVYFINVSHKNLLWIFERQPTSTYFTISVLKK